MGLYFAGCYFCLLNLMPLNLKSLWLIIFTILRKKQFQRQLIVPVQATFFIQYET